MNIRLILGTFFGAGYLPKIPGTWGSFFVLPLIYGTAYLFPQFGIPFFFISACLLSFACASEVQQKYGTDPAQFVMDECAGQSLVFLITGFTFILSEDVWILVIGFLLFRFFDIIKPLGIDKLQKLPGEIGILADDLLAGVYALICLEFIKHGYHTLF